MFASHRVCELYVECSPRHSRNAHAEGWLDEALGWPPRCAEAGDTANVARDKPGPKENQWTEI